MKQLLILITICISLTAQGQKTGPVKKFLIGFNFSPDYSFRTLKNNDGSSSSDLIINSRNGYEVAKFGYTTGLSFILNFSQLIGLETGVQYSNKGYKTKTQDLVYFPANPELPIKATTNYPYNYIGIPMKARFSFGKNKLRFITGIGFMTNLLLHAGQTTKYQYSDGRTEKKTQTRTYDFNEVDISSMISIGIDYNLNNKMHFTAEPTFRYGLTKTIDTPVSEKLWNAGINLGFYYVLR